MSSPWYWTTVDTSSPGWGLHDTNSLRVIMAVRYGIKMLVVRTFPGPVPAHSPCLQTHLLRLRSTHPKCVRLWVRQHPHPHLGGCQCLIIKRQLHSLVQGQAQGLNKHGSNREVYQGTIVGRR